jgi:hypothetical protein
MTGTTGRSLCPGLFEQAAEDGFDRLVEETRRVLVDGPETMVATIMFITMPPMVLPVATTLKTVPSECFGTRSTTSELMLMSHASEAITAQAARVIAGLRP